MDLSKCSILLTLLVVLIQVGYISTDPTSLIWTEKRLDGSVRIMGVLGEPDHWIDHGVPDFLSYGSPANLTVRRKSHRTALGYQYSTNTLFFSDVGYREIFRMKLGNSSKFEESVSNVNVEPVYSGVSTSVRGVAVDWQTGNVYWTDMLYNWITVAQGQGFDVYRHIVTTGLDTPYGVAVFPQKGYLFWTDQGVKPKVQRSMLDGSDIMTLLDRDLARPTGIAVDYTEGHLYLLDDGTDKLIKMTLDGKNMQSYDVKDPGDTKFQYLNGIDVYKDYVIISDQFMLSIKIYDKDMSFSRGQLGLTLGTPYDVMMYNSHNQAEFESQCLTLKCDHMCINMGDGLGKCICAQDYVLGSDDVSCTRSTTLFKPQYIYSVGSNICATHVRKANFDQDLHQPADGLQCFRGDVTNIEALAIDVHGDLLFFSDTVTGTISRARLEEGSVEEMHSLQVGTVRGLAVDWINSHLYWTDEKKGHIMVSNLNGRLATEIVANLDKPRAILVDPTTGYMFWSTAEGIYRANMDGSNPKIFVGGDINPDGMTINYQQKRLYWVDNVKHSIMSVMLNGTGKVTVYEAPAQTFRDVTVFQDYVAWTNGQNSIMIGEFDGKDMTNIRMVEHDTQEVSHDIVLHDVGAQPLVESACQLDNGGCSQLCLPKPNGRTCKCTIGFNLENDKASCKADVTGQDFLLFVDPVQKGLFQIDVLSEIAPTPVHGVELHESEMPTVIAYQEEEQMVYWYDDSERVIKRKLLTAPRYGEQVVVDLGENNHVGSMIINNADLMLMYVETLTGSIMGVHLRNIRLIDTFITGPVMPGTLAWEPNSRFMFWGAQSSTSGMAIYKGRPGMLPSKLLVIDQIPMDTMKGISIDSKVGRIYWWDDSRVYSAEIGGNDMGLEGIGDISSPIISIAAYDNVLFITEENKQSILRFDKLQGSSVEFTEPLFSQIQSMVISAESLPDMPEVIGSTQWPNTPQASTKPGDLSGKTSTKTPTAEPAIGTTSGGSNTIILAAAGAGAGVVVLIIIIVVIVCVIRRKKTKKQPKTIELEPKAHENPEYMRADDVPPRPAQTETRGASGIENPNYPVKQGVPFANPNQDRELPSITPMGMGLNDSTNNDTDTLVRNMADGSEVTLNMEGSDNMVVSYSKDE